MAFQLPGLENSEKMMEVTLQAFRIKILERWARQQLVPPANNLSDLEISSYISEFCFQSHFKKKWFVFFYCCWGGSLDKALYSVSLICLFLCQSYTALFILVCILISGRTSFFSLLTKESVRKRVNFSNFILVDFRMDL